MWTYKPGEASGDMERRLGMKLGLCSGKPVITILSLSSLLRIK